MPNICPRYAQHIPYICPTYSKNIIRICLIYAQDMSNICPRNAKNMLKTCQGHDKGSAQYLPIICHRYAQVMLNICPTYAQHMSQIGILPKERWDGLASSNTKVTVVSAQKDNQTTDHLPKYRASPDFHRIGPLGRFGLVVAMFVY